MSIDLILSLIESLVGLPGIAVSSALSTSVFTCAVVTVETVPVILPSIVAILSLIESLVGLPGIAVLRALSTSVLTCAVVTPAFLLEETLML